MSSFSFKSLVKVFIPVIGAMLFALPAKADLVEVSAFITGNDCSGYFNDPDNDPDYNGFSACWVFSGSGDDLVLLSPVIIKFGEDLSVSEISQRYSTIDGDEWMFSNTTDDNKTGDWAYSPDDEDDPAIRYWSAKAGNGFNLFWYVEDSVDCSTALSAECLGAAEVVTAGSWVTPLNNGGQQAELSHIVFYDSEGGDVPPQEIPETGTIALLLLGMTGIVLGRRRK